ncbi:MAG: hypothetical protein KH301_02585 [Brachyspira sp.]|nr:hypothetical protein [Brachyspira sp.]
MIVSENIIIKLTVPFDNSDIERELENLHIKPLRWAIVNAFDSELILNVSYVKES